MDQNLLRHVAERLDQTRYEDAWHRVLPMHATKRDDTVLLTLNFGAGGMVTYRLTLERLS
jgi:hypothetical protein